jgi:hypothetical protein
VDSVSCHGPAALSTLRARAGRCFVRDYQGRVARCQVDLVDPALLERLDTTPHRRDLQERGADGQALAPA